MSQLTFYEDINLSKPDELLLNNASFWALTPSQSQMMLKSSVIFNSSECDEIIKLGKRHNVSKSLVGDGSGEDKDKIRSSNNSWIPPNDISSWLYEKIAFAINEANKFYQFDLISIENLQFTEYNSNKQGHYSKHIDTHHNALMPNLYRKLSFSIQLSNPKIYEGGDLLAYFDGDENPEKASRALGSINFFPSFAMHEVTPTTKGVRYSLVGWASGPRLK